MMLLVRLRVTPLPTYPLQGRERWASLTRRGPRTRIPYLCSCAGLHAGLVEPACIPGGWPDTSGGQLHGACRASHRLERCRDRGGEEDTLVAAEAARCNMRALATGRPWQFRCREVL